jgi:LCP family protein required for cell wall assembly
MRWTAIVVTVALVAGAGGAAWSWKEIERRLHRTEVDLQPVTGPAMNVLVIGSDSRSGLRDPEDIKRFGRSVEGKRSDTIILAQIVPSQKRAVLIHFPRDLWVSIPGRRDAKINSAYDLGPQTLVDTIERLSGVPINHYVEVDIKGFRNMVNSVGGIDVCLDRPLRDSVLQFRLPAGPSHLDGNTALTFVRSRHADPDGDFGRIRRQQQFLRAVVSKVGRPSVLLNPFRLNGLATAFASNVTADKELALGDLIPLARSVQRVTPEQMETFTVPGDIGRAGGQSVVLVDKVKAGKLFSAVRNAEDPKGVLEPAPTELVVEDASGKSVGASVAESLKARGFSVLRMVDSAQVKTQTSVIAPRSAANDARKVVAIVPGSTLLFGEGEMRLVIGSSFKGLVPAPKGEGPAPAGPCAGFNPAA